MRSLIVTAAALAALSASPAFAQGGSFGRSANQEMSAGMNARPAGGLSGIGGASISGPRVDPLSMPSAPSPWSSSTVPTLSGSFDTLPGLPSPDSLAGPAVTGPALGGASTSPIGSAPNLKPRAPGANDMSMIQPPKSPLPAGALSADAPTATGPGN